MTNIISVISLLSYESLWLKTPLIHQLLDINATTPVLPIPVFARCVIYKSQYIQIHLLSNSYTCTFHLPRIPVLFQLHANYNFPYKHCLLPNFSACKDTYCQIHIAHCVVFFELSMTLFYIAVITVYLTERKLLHQRLHWMPKLTVDLLYLICQWMWYVVDNCFYGETDVASHHIILNTNITAQANMNVFGHVKLNPWHTITTGSLWYKTKIPKVTLFSGSSCSVVVVRILPVATGSQKYYVVVTKLEVLLSWLIEINDKTYQFILFIRKT